MKVWPNSRAFMNVGLYKLYINGELALSELSLYKEVDR